MNFPEKLITLRKSRGLSQEQLAERLGVSRQAVSRWEMGETTPDMTNLEGLCTFFGVSADYLIFDRKDTPSKAPEAEKSESECVKDNKFKKTMLLVSSIGFTVATAMAIVGLFNAIGDDKVIVSVAIFAMMLCAAAVQWINYFRMK